MPNFENVDPEELKKIAEKMQKKENEGLSPKKIEKKNHEKEIKKKKNIKTVNETLEICKNGYYEKNNKAINFKFSKEELEKTAVIFPEETIENSNNQTNNCNFTCENKDALSLANEKYANSSYNDEKILILNLASCTRPGGGTRDGANGQEEDLCKKSTLLMSLDSNEASKYYTYNNNLKTHLGSDAMMLSPDVAVFRDENDELLDEPFYISVLSASAPMIRLGLEGKTEKEYENMLLNRIKRILQIAIKNNYKNLILGAFGCGAFGNDARIVSDTFKKAFDEVGKNNFKHINFAVLCKDKKDYNFKEFYRNFGV